MNGWYNLTLVNASNVLVMTQSIKDQYFTPLGDMILLLIFFVTFISFTHYNNNPKINFVASSFIISMLSLIFAVLGLVYNWTPYLCWGVFAVSIAILTMTK